jgi:hypothetical protein
MILMNKFDFVFFHIGDTTSPKLLTKSIKKFNPDSKIFYITDKKNANIDGVTNTIRIDCNPKELMTSRILGFSELKLNSPAIYIDTDVLIIKKIPNELFNQKQIYLCKRSFLFDQKINTSFKNMDLSEYKNKTLGEVYPFVACFTYAANYKFWEECYKILINLNKKFHYWYGDQEALRIINDQKKFNIDYLDESLICSPPEIINKNKVYSIHFKGLHRKKLMINLAEKILV